MQVIWCPYHVQVVHGRVLLLLDENIDWYFLFRKYAPRLSLIRFDWLRGKGKKTAHQSTTRPQPNKSKKKKKLLSGVIFYIRKQTPWRAFSRLYPSPHQFPCVSLRVFRRFNFLTIWYFFSFFLYFFLRSFRFTSKNKTSFVKSYIPKNKNVSP